MLISNKLHSFRNFQRQINYYKHFRYDDRQRQNYSKSLEKANEKEEMSS